MLNTKTENFLINDPVPRNASKFPIHQTYLTDDAERTGNGGYKFKAPEVWSSARSAKKSIAIRSIQWNSKSEFLQFTLRIYISSIEFEFNFRATIPPKTSLNDIITMIDERFREWINETDGALKLILDFEFNESKLTFHIINIQDDEKLEEIKIEEFLEPTKPSQSLNRLLNQPLDYFPAKSDEIVFDNVWDRNTALNFHASFVPFDNYQYLGTVFDKWNNPIIYQDANTSPLFNVWITTDMKTPIKLLHESFIIRITFIISSESQYHA